MPLLKNQEIIGFVWEGCWHAAHFIKQVVESRPEFTDELNIVYDCYMIIRDLMWQCWEIIPFWNSDIQIIKFSELPARRKLADKILQECDKKAEAVGVIEKVLEKW